MRIWKITVAFLILAFCSTTSIYAVDDIVAFTDWDITTPFKVVGHDPDGDGTLNDITVEEYLKAVLYGDCCKTVGFGEIYGQRWGRFGRKVKKWSLLPQFISQVTHCYRF